VDTRKALAVVSEFNLVYSELWEMVGNGFDKMVNEEIGTGSFLMGSRERHPMLRLILHKGREGGRKEETCKQ